MRRVWQGTVKNEDIQSYVTTKKIKFKIYNRDGSLDGSFFMKD